MFGLAPGTGLSTLSGGMAETLPTGLGPTAGGIMTSRPGEGLGAGVRAGLTDGEAPLAGLRGRGLWGGKGDGLGCRSDTDSGDRVGLRGRGFLGGLSLCGVGGDLCGAAGGLPVGSGGRTTLMSREAPWGDGAGLRGRTMLTGWVPLGAGPGLRGRTSLLV